VYITFDNYKDIIVKIYILFKNKKKKKKKKKNIKKKKKKKKTIITYF